MFYLIQETNISTNRVAIDFWKKKTKNNSRTFQEYSQNSQEHNFRKIIAFQIIIYIFFTPTKCQGNRIFTSIKSFYSYIFVKLIFNA